MRHIRLHYIYVCAQTNIELWNQVQTFLDKHPWCPLPHKKYIAVGVEIYRGAFISESICLYHFIKRGRTNSNALCLYHFIIWSVTKTRANFNMFEIIIFKTMVLVAFCIHAHVYNTLHVHVTIVILLKKKKGGETKMKK